ncbi:hypothetical protein DFJ73DRAFT_871581 [Zopfochytrium polystomum]|nr:hypothetical protein DFJ73DRAFT_871581 [Zopfochytrium polystomum]
MRTHLLIVVASVAANVTGDHVAHAKFLHFGRHLAGLVDGGGDGWCCEAVERGWCACGWREDYERRGRGRVLTLPHRDVRDLDQPSAIASTLYALPANERVGYEAQAVEESKGINDELGGRWM